MTKSATTGSSIIEMEVFSNRLLSVTDEMSTSLIKSSFSTNIKERRDCSVGMFDAKGRLIAQASSIPLHLGSLKGSVQSVLDNFNSEDIHDGDAFISNDPYLAGGTHTPDISVVTPIFIEGKLRFFAANIGHHTDVGGPSPGSTGPTLTSIFSEGLRIPTLKIVRKHQIDVPLLGLISANSRDPLERELDLKVQVATNELGLRAMHRLVKQDGIDHILSVIDELIDYSASRLSSAISEIADGTYCGEAFMDNDGMGGDILKIAVAVTISGEKIHFDFEGTSQQARGGYNVARSALEASCYYAAKSLFDPSIPPNEGMFLPISIVAPKGTILNPQFPAATGSRSHTCQKIARAIFLAFADVLPDDKIIAPSCDMNGSLVFSGMRKNNGGRFVYLETVGGGGGATSFRDGLDAVQVHITNTSNLPTEALELEYPLFVRQYGLVEHSAGLGKWRGGAGIVREVVATDDGIIASSRSDCMRTPADGIRGGGTGSCAKVACARHDHPLEYSDGILTNIILNKGDSIRLETPGGGGYGKQEDRPAHLRERDKRERLCMEK